jgi:hypothetical protein
MESIRLRKLSTLAMLLDSAPQEYRSTASIEMPFSWLKPRSTPSERPVTVSTDIRTVRVDPCIETSLMSLLKHGATTLQQTMLLNLSKIAAKYGFDQSELSP